MTPRWWNLALLLAGIASAGTFLCGTNLVAFAVLAARAWPLRRAIPALLAVWGTGQIAGYAWLGFPHAPLTVAWGIALGGAGVLAVAVARPFARLPVASGVPLALAAAFVAYELALLAFGAVAGDIAGPFALPVIKAVFTGNAIALAFFAAAAGIALAVGAVAGAGSEKRA